MRPVTGTHSIRTDSASNLLSTLWELGGRNNEGERLGIEQGDLVVEVGASEQKLLIPQPVLDFLSKLLVALD